MTKKQTQPNGFGIVEIIVAIAVISLTFLSIYQLLLTSARLMNDDTRRIEALYLAQEGIEVVRLLRNQSWSSGIAPVIPETLYYPMLENNAWTLSRSDPGPQNGRFTRTIMLHTAYRDSNDTLSESGTEDPDTRKVTVTVTWQEREQARSVTLETYLANFLNN